MARYRFMEGMVQWLRGNEEGAMENWAQGLGEARKSTGHDSYDAGVAHFLLGRFEKPGTLSFIIIL